MPRKLEVNGYDGKRVLSDRVNLLRHWNPDQHGGWLMIALIVMLATAVILLYIKDLLEDVEW